MDRPFPPPSILELSDQAHFGIRLTPASEVWEWLQAEILADTGSIHNEDHAHLLDADIRIMWASSSFNKQLGVKIDSADAIRAKTSLDEMAKAGGRVEQSDHVGRTLPGNPIRQLQNGGFAGELILVEFEKQGRE
ncbi:Phage tail length tape-measure protein 1 [Pseudomonas sp. R4-34-07]|nr:Phage tail length tape-measure protein 1 [Pseudomonas sp. R4-34-07]